MQSYILDTNIWLDWFVFTHEPNAAITALKQALAQNASIIMTAEMWEEWTDVLGRDKFKVDAERQNDILAQTQALVQWTETPATPTECIRCSDKDDQVFIDTAIALKVNWLVSKDRHLLDLRNRARKHAIKIVTPEQWLQQTSLPVME